MDQSILHLSYNLVVTQRRNRNIFGRLLQKARINPDSDELYNAYLRHATVRYYYVRTCQQGFLLSTSTFSLLVRTIQSNSRMQKSVFLEDRDSKANLSKQEFLGCRSAHCLRCSGSSRLAHIRERQFHIL